MRVHRLQHGDASHGNVVAWFPSKREAQHALARLRREGELDATYPVSLEPVDIPTDKAGLLRWLNAYVITDNG